MAWRDRRRVRAGWRAAVGPGAPEPLGGSAERQTRDVTTSFPDRRCEPTNYSDIGTVSAALGRRLVASCLGSARDPTGGRIVVADPVSCVRADGVTRHALPDDGPGCNEPADSDALAANERPDCSPDGPVHPDEPANPSTNNSPDPVADPASDPAADPAADLATTNSQPATASDSAANFPADPNAIPAPAAPARHLLCERRGQRGRAGLDLRGHDRP